MTRDDAFSGRVRQRILRADRIAAAAALDAQCRDWTAERADRVGFARLAQVHHELQRAAAAEETSKYDPVSVALSFAAWAGTIVVILVVADRATAPLTLAAACAAAGLASFTALTVLRYLRRRRAWHAPTGPAPIDDPHLYADLTRRIEACAAEVRANPRKVHPDAAGTLEQALIWLALARDELTNRTSSRD